jgi:predicted RNase H-like nuclease
MPLRIAQLSPYVLGLDWISKEYGWAYCKITIEGEREDVTLGRLSLESIEAHKCDDIKDAERIVIDAPIGLPSGLIGPLGTRTAAVATMRPCDSGARTWLFSDYKKSVFAVPHDAELTDYRERIKNGHNIKSGHILSLLPMIDGAERIAATRPGHVLESHPELVFAALNGRSLLPNAVKTTLAGMLLRLGVLNKRGLHIPLPELASTSSRKIETHNYIDAAAMAVVARGWYSHDDISVIRLADGAPEPLSQGPNTQLMALPAEYIDPRNEIPDQPESIKVATHWMEACN